MSEGHFRNSIELDVAHLQGDVPAVIELYANEALEELDRGNGDTSREGDAPVVSDENS